MSSPIIFEKGTRDFSTLGLGLLSDAIQATTTEELNGQFIFEMDYPVSGNNADLIKENRIIVVNSGHILKRQGFIIRQIVRKIDLTMTVYAEHVSYATLDVALAPIGTISGDAKTALENWKRMLVPAVDFTVDSDILTTNYTSIGAPEFETARQGLGGHAGSILDVWGGEYQFDNWHIRLLKQRGKSANAIIAYGRNLISFEQDTNIADTYTSVYPYYQENSGDDGNKTHFLPERTVDSEFVGKYPNPKVLMLDLSNKFKGVADYSETKLRNYALSYIQSNNIGVPKVNMKISTVDLSRATGGFSEDIDLGDTVNVYFEKLGITTSAKVIKAVWNVLSDDYDKFEIGARRASLTESISELATTADENANKALNQALVALQSADGKSTIYYLNSSDPWPTNPNENDTAFVKDGENSIMYRYMFNNDTGMFSWVKILDSMSADQIKQRVSDALESGKAYSDQLVADNVAQVNAVLSDVQAKQADLTAQQAELDTKAQGYADKALADAKADTLATATQTAKDASDALAKAKTDLTTSLNKEVTDRTKAVSDLDTKAKGYADTAKNDAISAGATADGVINKKIDDTASSITSTISQNKTDADGKITTAQSTATQALNGLATKVSQTVYDAKTGQLQTDLNTTTTTANQAKTDIVAIKSDNTKQDARMTTIESDANGTKTTVSNLQTDLGKANGSITTLQQRADGFDATVTKVNNLSVGGRNLVLGTATDTTWTAEASNWSFNVIATGLKPNQTYTFSAEVTLGNTDQKNTTISLYDAPIGQRLASTDHFKADGTRDHWTFTVPSTVDTPTASLIIYAGTPGSTGGKSATYHHIKLEQGNLPTDWGPAPEDVDSATAKAQLTADKASLDLSKYQTDADGRISKAQADIIVNANAITQKVSQSDYNAKTGDLTTKVNTAQSTADSATSTIGSYKTANDARVASAESKITANANAITQKVSQTDYNQKTGELSGQISQVSQTAGQISQTVSDVKAQVDGLSVGGRNLYTDTKNFDNLASWWGSSRWTKTTDSYNGLAVIQTTQDWSGISQYIQVKKGDVLTYSVYAKYTSGTGTSSIYWKLSNQTEGSYSTATTNPDNNAVTITDSWQRISLTITVTSDGYLRPRLERTNNNTNTLQIAGIKVEQGNMPTDWTPAPEDVDNKISTVSQTVDSISSILSDPATGLTKRVQTAEGSISTVQSNVSDLQSKQTQTANELTTEISDRQKGDTNTLTQAKDFTTSSISNSESGMRSQITQTSDAILAQVSNTGVRYVRINGQGNQDNTGTHFMRVSLFDSSGKDLLLGKTATVSGPNSPYFRDNNGGNGATDGSVTTYSAIYPEPNANNFMVYDLGAVTYTAQRFEVKMWTSTRTYKGVTIQVSPDNKSWRTILQEDVKSISGDITKPDTTINLGSTSSATQLALLKDNWSIGIADNAGALASGIAGDLNGMTLISKKITLDGNTTVTGDFYAKGGNFKNLNASNITAGNLDADEVRIINLDVNTLTGDVSRFLETNWNGAYGSTKITSTGMKINTQYIQADFQGFGMDFSYSNKKIGGMGISQYLNGEPGLSMRLESNGAYMSWSARNEGDYTGSYVDKLAWYRQGKPALGGNYGFIFSDRVTFNKPINVEGASINLGFRPINIDGNLFPFFGNHDNITGFTYTSNEIYMVLQNQYVNLSNVIKALSGLGTWSVPTNIDSTGKVTQWRNVTT
ncbi:phage tail spike protein [Leuconostoc lactis]|uniref:phage tail spike protein n=1 Tax=Leuconostoc lactis TaxID=1246 RepID=UPI0006DC03CE|nr:phage tail spike protein [Leuconostoc lactis]